MGGFLGGLFGGGGTTIEAPDNNPGMIAMARAQELSSVAQSNASLEEARINAVTTKLAIDTSASTAKFEGMVSLLEQMGSSETRMKILATSAYAMMKRDHNDFRIQVMTGQMNALEREKQRAESNKGD